MDSFAWKGVGLAGSAIATPVEPQTPSLHLRRRTASSPRNNPDRFRREFFFQVILQGASRYIYAIDAGEIHRIRPRKVSQEQCVAEAQVWANWQEMQSEEEAEYPD
ncbi:hypothetical protein D3C71_601040 [compost metagenome]